MKVLHLLVNGPDSLSEKIIEGQSGAAETTVIDMTKGDVNYDELVDTIFAHDKLISW